MPVSLSRQVAELRQALRAMPDFERALGAARNAAAQPSPALPPAILRSLQKKCAPLSPHD